MTEHYKIKSSEQQKVKKLKLEPYQMISIDHIDIRVKEFPLSDEDGKPCTGFGAFLLLWVDRGELSAFPIALHIPVAGEYLKDVVSGAVEVAYGMCASVDTEFKLILLQGGEVSVSVEHILSFEDDDESDDDVVATSK